MAINFKKFAQKKTTLSDIMISRTKMDKTDGVYDIVDFDIISIGNGEPYAVCAISDSEFINGGCILTDLFIDIVSEYHGDIDAARHDFRESGGFKVKLTKKPTRDKSRTVVSVEVID